MTLGRFVTILALSGAVILAMTGSATAQTSTLQIYTSFAGQYDTAMGWRTTYGNPSVGNAMAEPTIAAGAYEGQTRLLLAADNSIGWFYNALQGPDDIHNAQQDLASTLSGVLPSGFIATQPQVLRDQSAFQLPGQPTEMLDRFITIARAFNPNTQESRIVGWVTRYNVAGETGQCLFAFNANDTGTNSLFADSPRAGLDENAVLITANMYSNADSSFQYAKLRSIPKATIYNDPSSGTCPVSPVPTSLVLNQEHNSDGSLPFSVVPARRYDGSTTAYMVNALSNGGTTLTLWVLDTSNPAVISETHGPVPVSPYSSPPNAEQSGTSTLINTWDTRIFNAVYQTGGGLWTANTTGCTPPGDTVQRACVQWYEIDPTSMTVGQQGLVENPGWYYYAPAIAANPYGDAVLVFNGSSTSDYVGIYFTGRYHTAPLNTMQASISALKSGEGCYVRSAGNNTVSLHSDATLDPIYSGVFWLHSAYVYGSDSNCQNNDWATGVGAVQFQVPAPAWQQVPGLLTQIAVGSAGNVWGLNSAGQIFRFNPQTQNWQQISGLLTQIAVASDGTVWGINSAQEIYRFDPQIQSWDHIPGLLTQIAVGSAGVVWGINSAQQIFRFDSGTQGWDQIPGLLAHIAVAADGSVWGLNAQQEIFRFDPQTRGWDWIPGLLTHIAVGSANAVWGINAAGEIFRYNSQTQGWDQIPGQLTQIAVAYDGVVWGINSAQEIFTFDSQTQGWDQVSGLLTQIAVGSDGAVWGLNSSGQIFRLQ